MIKKTAVVLFSILLLFIFCGCNDGSDVDRPEMTYQEEITIGEKLGDSIIQKIEAFYSEHGKYPDSLEDLIPKYLDEVPVTINGDPFRYQLNQVNIYILSFKVVRHDLPTSCGYLRNIETWDCSHGVESNN